MKHVKLILISLILVLTQGCGLYLHNTSLAVGTTGFINDAMQPKAIYKTYELRAPQTLLRQPQKEKGNSY